VTLFEVLRNELGNDKAVMDLALRKVFSYLKPYRGVKDLSRHVDDMVQNILADWILVPAKEDLELPQIITYAHERGRFCIQSYLEKFEFVVEVPRAVQRSKFGAPESTDLEYADLGWDESDDFGEGDLVLENAWKTIFYEGIKVSDSWALWFLSQGFSINQAAVLCGKSTKTIRRVIDRAKDELS